MTEPGQLMTIAALQTSIEQDMEPPSGITGPLAAHWHVGKGNLDKAMELLKSEAGKDAAWVRAHLHRRKGEDDEAREWYARAEQASAEDEALHEEWSRIAMGLMLKG